LRAARIAQFFSLIDYAPHTFLVHGGVY